jgi:hypothetical protein
MKSFEPGQLVRLKFRVFNNRYAWLVDVCRGCKGKVEAGMKIIQTQGEFQIVSSFQP